MLALISYLKSFENTVSKQESKLVVDKNSFELEGFNPISYAKLVLAKTSDSEEVINSLKELKETIKEEIIGEVNKNFDNYVILISKMQVISYLIANIEKPFKEIAESLSKQHDIITNIEKINREHLQELSKNQKELEIVENQIKEKNLKEKMTKLIHKINEKRSFYETLSIKERSNSLTRAHSKPYHETRQFATRVSPNC